LFNIFLSKLYIRSDIKQRDSLKKSVLFAIIGLLYNTANVKVAALTHARHLSLTLLVHIALK